MDFLDTLKDKISHTTRVVAKKSNELVELTKLRAQAADQEREIDGILRKIGQALYDAYKVGGESYDSIEDACEELDAAYARLDELQEKIGELKNVKKCPACQKEMDKDAVFCSVCGVKFE